MRTIVTIIVVVIVISAIGTGVTLAIISNIVSSAGNALGGNYSGVEQDWRDLLEECNNINSFGTYAGVDYRYDVLSKKTQQNAIDNNLTREDISDDFQSVVTSTAQCMNEKREKYLGY